MAKIHLKNENCVTGPLYVDESCIDCGTCFHIAPQLFKEDNHSKSYTLKQPESIHEWTQAKEAVLSCPTNSIGVEHAPHEFAEAPLSLPRLITDDIYFCGYTAESSYGATAYFIVHPEGNILVDSPRFNKHLVNKFEEMGGVKYMFLTHRDDVADHAKYAEHFLCQRILHEKEIVADTAGVEIKIKGEADFQLAKDVKLIFTPGHTPGHMVMLYKEKYLFTGDHLFYDPEINSLYASKNVNWFSWDQQVKSLHKLTSFNFDWVFPGHGGWIQKDQSTIKTELNKI
jgi:ferredoxin